MPVHYCADTSFSNIFYSSHNTSFNRLIFSYTPRISFVYLNKVTFSCIISYCLSIIAFCTTRSILPLGLNAHQSALPDQAAVQCKVPLPSNSHPICNNIIFPSCSCTPIPRMRYRVYICFAINIRFAISYEFR